MLRLRGALALRRQIRPEAQRTGASARPVLALRQQRTVTQPIPAGLAMLDAATTILMAMNEPLTKPLFRTVDAVEIRVPSLDEGLAFYRDRLGHELIWRTATAAGLRLGEAATELVLQTERPNDFVDMLVDSADEAAQMFATAGGRIVAPAFDIAIGRCVVVADPWGNELVLLDARNGRLVTDAVGNVVGTEAGEVGAE